MAFTGIQITNKSSFFDHSSDWSSGAYGDDHSSIAIQGFTFPGGEFDSAIRVDNGSYGGWGLTGVYYGFHQDDAEINYSAVPTPSGVPAETLHLDLHAVAGSTDIYNDGFVSTGFGVGAVHLDAFSEPLPFYDGNGNQAMLSHLVLTGDFHTANTSYSPEGWVSRSSSDTQIIVVNTEIGFGDARPTLFDGAENFAVGAFANPQFAGTPYGTEQLIGTSGLAGGSFALHLFQSATGTGNLLFDGGKG